MFNKERMLIMSKTTNAQHLDNFYDSIDKLSHNFFQTTEKLYSDFDESTLEAQKTFTESSYNLKLIRPNRFNGFVNYTFKKFTSKLLELILNDQKNKGVNIDDNNILLLEFIYLEQEFILRYFQKMIKQYEGISCSTDKANWLLSIIVQSIIKPEEDITFEREKYYTPTIGEFDDWFSYVKAIHNLHYGYIDEFMEVKTALDEKFSQTKKDA